MKTQDMDKEIDRLRNCLKDALQCDKRNDHTSGSWQIEASELLGIPLEEDEEEN